MTLLNAKQSETITNKKNKLFLFYLCKLGIINTDVLGIINRQRHGAFFPIKLVLEYKLKKNNVHRQILIAISPVGRAKIFRPLPFYHIIIVSDDKKAGFTCLKIMIIIQWRNATSVLSTISQ